MNCTLKPFELTTSQTNKVIVSSKIENLFHHTFPQNTVEIKGFIFHLEYDDQISADQIGFSSHNRLFLFNMDELPT
jgi:hypothetical protein